MIRVLVKKKLNEDQNLVANSSSNGANGLAGAAQPQNQTTNDNGSGGLEGTPQPQNQTTVVNGSGGLEGIPLPQDQTTVANGSGGLEGTSQPQDQTTVVNGSGGLEGTSQPQDQTTNNNGSGGLDGTPLLTTTNTNGLVPQFDIKLYNDSIVNFANGIANQLKTGCSQLALELAIPLLKSARNAGYGTQIDAVNAAMKNIANETAPDKIFNGYSELLKALNSLTLPLNLGLGTTQQQL